MSWADDGVSVVVGRACDLRRRCASHRVRAVSGGGGKETV